MPRLMRKVAAYGVLAPLIFGAACGGSADQQTPSPVVPSPTPTPSPRTPTPNATHALTPAITSVPTETATPTLAPTSTRTPQWHTYPARTRTGIPAVDEVIEAVTAGDLDALVALVQFSSVPCGPRGAPACPPGSPDGTPIQVFFVGKAGPTQYPADRAQVRGWLADFKLAPFYLFAVFRTAGSTADDQLYETAYGLAFSYDPPGDPTAGAWPTLFIDESGHLRKFYKETFSVLHPLPASWDFVLPPQRH